MSDRFRVLMVTGAFPLASETFIREQAVELVEQGADLEILALRPGDGTWGDRDLEVDLASRTRTADIDRPRGERIARMPWRMASLAAQGGHPLAAISPRLGWRATSGQLLEIAAALGGPRRYDAIHCQFGPMGRIMLRAVDAGIVEGPLSVAFYGYDITRELLKHGDDVYAEMFDRVSVLLPNSEYLGQRVGVEMVPVRVGDQRVGAAGVGGDRYEPLGGVPVPEVATDGVDEHGGVAGDELHAGPGQPLDVECRRRRGGRGVKQGEQEESGCCTVHLRESRPEARPGTVVVRDEEIRETG